MGEIVFNKPNSDFHIKFLLKVFKLEKIKNMDYKNIVIFS